MPRIKLPQRYRITDLLSPRITALNIGHRPFVHYTFLLFCFLLFIVIIIVIITFDIFASFKYLAARAESSSLSLSLSPLQFVTAVENRGPRFLNLATQARNQLRLDNSSILTTCCAIDINGMRTSSPITELHVCHRGARAFGHYKSKPELFMLYSAFIDWSVLLSVCKPVMYWKLYPSLLDLVLHLEKWKTRLATPDRTRHLEVRSLEIDNRCHRA